MIKSPVHPPHHQEQALATAIDALSFIAQNAGLLQRFVAISGIAPEAMRQAAQAPEFPAGVLSFLLNHEPDLLQFCAHTNRHPGSVAQAFAALPGGGAFADKV